MGFKMYTWRGWHFIIQVWTNYNGKIEVVSFYCRKLTIGVKYEINVRNEAEEAVSVISFFSNSLENISEIQLECLDYYLF
jgi:hypothetical protein